MGRGRTVGTIRRNAYPQKMEQRGLLLKSK